MKTRSTRDERGFAVPLALLIIVALGLVGGAAAYMSAGDTNVAGLYSGANRVSDAASAGIEHAVGEYRKRMIDYSPSEGDMGEWMETMPWPVSGKIDGFDYTVTAKRDSFDFDGDGNAEPVSCTPGNNGNNGNNGNGGNNGNNGNGSGGGDTGDENNGDYWSEEGKDKDGDGEAGLAGGHFDVDVWRKKDGSTDIEREYHQHEFDDKYDTNQADLRNDPNLLWNELFFGGEKKNEQTEYPNDVRVEFFHEDNASGTYEIKLTGGGGTIEGEIGDGNTHTFDPNDVKDFRVRFSSLLTFACTDPGSVDKDQVDRDGAYHLRVYDDQTGEMVYEWGAYWHAKEDECQEKKQQMQNDDGDDGDQGGDDGGGNNGNGNGNDNGNNGNGNNGNGNNKNTTCEINGDGDGDPVFILTSTATRENFTASEQLRVSSDETTDTTYRLGWLAD